MLDKIFLVFLCLVVTFLVLDLDALAQPLPRAKHADRNKDGRVDRKERHLEKEREKKQRSQVNTWWESRADVNNDGRVDSQELSAWKSLESQRLDLNNDGVISPKERRRCWIYARSRVNTALEKKYDSNNDGWLQPDEAREFLQDRYALIKTGGKARVDSPIEEEYDTDGDGIIDAQEAEALKEDLI
ncbi:MAG: hypothetical protein PVI33_03155 [Candidatus Omnitrophota bacterium]|jgi:hypothetical protein